VATVGGVFAPLLALTLSASPSVWNELRAAEAVARVDVLEVDEQAGARVRVKERLKGELPETLLLPGTSQDGTCFATRALEPGPDQVVLLTRTEGLVRELRQKSPELSASLDEAVRRHPWQYAGLRYHAEALPLLKRALQQQAAGALAPTEDWALELFDVPGMRGSALDVFAQDLPRSPRILAALERWLLSRTLHPLYLVRVLRLLSANPDPNLTAAAFDVLDAALAKGWDFAGDDVFDLLAAREGLPPPEGQGPKARRKALELARKAQGKPAPAAR
jgi:hypothetical protein